MSHKLNDRKKERWKKYGAAFLFVAFASGVGEWVQRDLEPTNLVMLYLAAVVTAATLLGRGPAILASVLSVLAFDVLFVPPKFSLTVHDTQYLITFAGLLVVGLIISELTHRTREQAIRSSEEAKRIELLSEKEKLQTALLNCISHDLRTPLVAITGALSHLVGDKTLLEDPAYRGLIETAHEEVGRLNRIVTNWLDMTKIEAGALKISGKSCDLKDVVGVALGNWKSELGNRPIQIGIQDDLPEIAIDFSLMLKILINVLDNAVKYSEVASAIDIEARAMEGRLEIKVLDRGMGIPEEDLERVFDKFYRVATSTKVSGTGLGLPISKGIIEAHRGTISARNRLGGGTIICITLPVVGD